MIDLISLSVCSVSACFWLILLFMPVRWRMSERWEATDKPPSPVSQLPSLSVIVPARNEGDSLPLTLPSWLDQDYPGSEVILIDDESTDGTEECARSIASRSNRAIRIIKGTLPPPGWTGKLWALQQGINVSTGEWLLFTDADIRHCPNLWRELVTKALTEQREMVSLMAFLDTEGMWARLLIPAFVYFFHFMYPFVKVRDSRSKISAAAGGCVLISRRALDTIGGIAGHRNAIIDDMALARRIKQAGMPLSLSLTISAVSIRPYRRLSDIWDMVARSAFAQLRCSWLALIGAVLGMLILFIAPMVGICAFIGQIVSPATPIISLVALSLMALTYIPTIRFFRLGVSRVFTLPIAGLLYMAMTVSSALNHLFGQHVWRGDRTRKAL